MALSDSSTSSPPLPQSSSRKESPAAITAKIAELGESRSELLGRIQGLKQDLQSWRSKLDTQVKVYRDELQELKKSLNNEVELLRTEFQDLRTTLQQQQDDVDASLRNLGLQDSSGDAEKIATPTIEEKSVVAVEENELSKENGTEADDMSSQCVEQP